MISTYKTAVIEASVDQVQIEDIFFRDFSSLLFSIQG